jgi:hypothetical protein
MNHLGTALLVEWTGPARTLFAMDSKYRRVRPSFSRFRLDDVQGIGRPWALRSVDELASFTDAGTRRTGGLQVGC